MNDYFIDKYLLKDDLSTYDPYDIWKTNLGIKIVFLNNTKRLLSVEIPE